MLTKEYRIPLPLSLNEYKIAQLFMIQVYNFDDTAYCRAALMLTLNAYRNPHYLPLHKFYIYKKKKLIIKWHSVGTKITNPPVSTQKKSRLDSTGSDSSVEIIENEPYEDGPGGNGQYTKKIYHIGSHLPGWLKSLVPKTALRIEEEAWNAYPYTKTRFSCPFIDKFFVNIETYYLPDYGQTVSAKHKVSILRTLCELKCSS